MFETEAGQGDSSDVVSPKTNVRVSGDILNAKGINDINKMIKLKSD